MAVFTVHAVAAIGCSVSGQCLMVGQPFIGQPHGGGFVYEGDHTGGQIRTAVESAHPPWQSDAIMVTNHNMIRGCEPPYGESKPAYVHLRFSFSSFLGKRCRTLLLRVA